MNKTVYVREFAVPWIAMAPCGGITDNAYIPLWRLLPYACSLAPVCYSKALAAWHLMRELLPLCSRIPALVAASPSYVVYAVICPIDALSRRVLMTVCLQQPEVHEDPGLTRVALKRRGAHEVQVRRIVPFASSNTPGAVPWFTRHSCRHPRAPAYSGWHQRSARSGLRPRAAFVRDGLYPA